MIRLTEILKTYLEERLPIKYCVIKHLILKHFDMINVNVDLLHWLAHFLIKNLLVQEINL